jgi:AhpD family alkylhydroperoxidase
MMLREDDLSRIPSGGGTGRGKTDMTTVKLIEDAEKDARVKAVFDDIRATRKSDFINNFWLYLAFDPQLLEETWFGVKSVMAVPSSLDPLTKELIYIAVSITNSCRYCVHSHTAAARAKGMTDDMYADLLRVVSTAGRTNQLLNALQVPVDKAFEFE